MTLPGTVPSWGDIPENVYQEYLTSLLAGDRAACGGIVSSLLDCGCDIRRLYVSLFQRSLYEVGDLWEQNRITVAREHLATSVTEAMFSLVYPRLFAVPRTGRRGVVACVADEYHQMGGKMVADILELNGWDGYFLGANTPLEDLLSFIRERSPDMVCLSLSVWFNFGNLVAAVEATRREFPSIPLVVGGQAFRWGGREIGERAGVKLLESLESLENFLGGKG